MLKVLYIANYTEGVGGISGQVSVLHKNIDRNLYKSKIFSTKGKLLHRMIIIIQALFVVPKYDIIHMHGCSGWGGFFPVIIGTMAGLLFRKKRIITYHGGNADVFLSNYPKSTRFFLNRAHHIIVLSGYLQEIFQKHHYKVVTIPNVLINHGQLPALKEKILPDFISIRYLTPLYNIECIIKAFAIIKNDFPDATLTILGDGIDREKLEDFVRENKIDDVTFMGSVSNTEVAFYLEKASILLNAPFVDNMPVSILEAFYSGLLVISSNVGGIPFMIRDVENGYLFESNNHVQMAEKMLLALKEQGKSLKMMKNARESLKNYSWENVKKSLYSLYDYS
jgi:phenylacetate-CoA ligase